MFAGSSQLKYWTQSGSTELRRLRDEANQAYKRNNPHIKDTLTVEEEDKLLRHYQYVLCEFCNKFEPPMPRYVLGTSVMYFKRFYLHNSLMEYHPKYILVSQIKHIPPPKWCILAIVGRSRVCCYLACKVEEFNVTLIQFVSNCRSKDPELLADVILSLELLLMQQLHYHLTVHNPYRPIEGLIIDIKTRCKEIEDVEVLRPGADDFLSKALHTDVAMIFAPSQIALSSLLSSASKIGIDLDSYVAKKLLLSGGKDGLLKAQEHIKRIRFMVKNKDGLDRAEVKVIEKKLTHCLNPHNDPESQEYAERQLEMDEEEEDRQVRKKMKIAESFTDKTHPTTKMVHSGSC